MKTYKIFGLCLTVTVLLMSLSCFNSIARAEDQIDERVIRLWDSTVSCYLQDPLWRDRDACDAGHYLMVPLHAAFILDQETWIQDFANHIRKFSRRSTAITDNRLARLHYFYLASWFAVLAEKTGRGYLVPSRMIRMLTNEVYNLWRVEPAWQWAREPFLGGIRERLAWKMSVKESGYDYYRAIIDEEFFLIAIAANLRVYEMLTGIESSRSGTLSEILNVAYRVFKRFVVWKKSGCWLFQPGVKWDHPDYAYAGRTEKKLGMEPLRVPGIAGDSSHSHRFPLWLTSLAMSFDQGSKRRRYFEELRSGLNRHFLKVVLVEPTRRFPNYRTTNFMDGRNGIYRWGYITQGENNGYGPYELSGTFLLGWWSFLDSRRIRSVYADMADRFPLPIDVIEVYTDHTTRERNSLVTEPDFYQNGFAELIVNLASKVTCNNLNSD